MQKQHILSRPRAQSLSPPHTHSCGSHIHTIHTQPRPATHTQPRPATRKHRRPAPRSQPCHAPQTHSPGMLNEHILGRESTMMPPSPVVHTNTASVHHTHTAVVATHWQTHRPVHTGRCTQRTKARARSAHSQMHAAHTGQCTIAYWPRHKALMAGRCTQRTQASARSSHLPGHTSHTGR